MQEPDLIYVKGDFYTRFIAVSDAGETAWREMAAQCGGDATVQNKHLDYTLRMLRKANYIVKKAKKPTQAEINAVLDEVGAL